MIIEGSREYKAAQELERALNATELATGICSALHGDNKYQWFLS